MSTCANVFLPFVTILSLGINLILKGILSAVVPILSNSSAVLFNLLSLLSLFSGLILSRVSGCTLNFNFGITYSPIHNDD